MLTSLTILADRLLDGFCRGPMITSQIETFLMLCVAMPLLEEYIMQAGIHEWVLRKRRTLDRSHSSTDWMAIGITALLFSLWHLHRSWWLPLAVFFPGICFAWIFQKTGRWWLSAIVHSLCNLIGWGFCTVWR